MEISVANTMEVRVVAPRHVSQKQIHDFIIQKSGWIAAQLKEIQKIRDVLGRKQYDHGNQFLFLGKSYPLHIEEADVRMARISFDGSRWNIRVPLQGSKDERRSLVKEKLTQWYRDQALEVLGGRIFHFARIMDVDPKKIAVRTQKRIWGSCGFRSKSISLNWQLVLAPMDVIDYVVVHELSHLLVPSHSQKFWKKVGQVMPDYKARKKWLLSNRLAMFLP